MRLARQPIIVTCVHVPDIFEGHERHNNHQYEPKPK